ncbi:ATP-binding protein [Gaopeijia maritima]|uniref:histidine kinase n=1 Tax=Gaopeijia maritima TaxID=3119007 RepID=A0ABU9E8L6_9BACT
MTFPSSPFSAFLGSRLHERREDLAHRWVRILSDQLPVDGREVFPSDDLLNHIPDILERVAEFVADPEAEVLEAMVIDDLARLAELRRCQGFGVQELLREYRILAELLQDESEAAAADFDGTVHVVEVVRAVGRLKEATFLLSSVTARSFELWQGRYAQERQEVLATYGQILSHELGNRLGAAETAAQLLATHADLPPEKVARLIDLIIESVRRGLQTVDDIGILARPLDKKVRSAPIGLRLLVKESVRLVEARAERKGIAVIEEGEAPDVRVAGSPMRVALSNLLSNAVKYHRDGPPDRWIKVTGTLDGETVLVVVEDNGPGIPEKDRERVFHHHFRGNVIEEGSGLGLAITRDALSAVGGSVSLSEGEQGGARFTVRIPTIDDEVESR